MTCMRDREILLRDSVYPSLIFKNNTSFFLFVHYWDGDPPTFFSENDITKTYHNISIEGDILSLLWTAVQEDLFVRDTKASKQPKKRST